MYAGFIIIHTVAPANIACFNGYRSAAERVPSESKLIEIPGMKRFLQTGRHLADQEPFHPSSSL